MTGTRIATWTDKDGRKFASVIPANMPDSEASRGATLGPPSLAPLKLPKATEIRIHNELHASGLYTFEDFRQRPADANRAIQRALKVDAQEIMARCFGDAE